MNDVCYRNKKQKPAGLIPILLSVTSITIIIVLLSMGCGHNRRTHFDKFYDTTEVDWDLIRLPIVNPYYAASTNNGQSWFIQFCGDSADSVEALGVSKNFIYGYGRSLIINGQIKKGWFAFNINSKFIVAYRDKRDLILCLKDFKIPVRDMADCNVYMDSLASGNNLSWYPKSAKSYPLYPDIIPQDVGDINVIGKPNAIPDFYFNPVIKARKSKIYFFRIHYNKTDSLYYLSFPYEQSTLVKDNIRVPVFMDSDKVDIKLFGGWFTKVKTLTIQ